MHETRSTRRPRKAAVTIHDVAARAGVTGLPLALRNTARDTHAAITIHNCGGARTRIRHLAQLGHTRIAFVKGPDHNADARERLRGYRHAMRAIPGGERREIDGDFTERSGYDAAIELMESPPTAIFAANDSMAVGVLSALAEKNVSVPGEMSVVGFDDIPIAHYVAPPLTTIRVDIAELGRRAFALLLAALAGQGGAPHRQECIGTTLVVRKSSASPRVRKKGEIS